VCCSRGAVRHLEFVVVGASLEHGLVAAPATRNLPNRATAPRGDRLLRPRGELNARETRIRVVRDKDAVLAFRV